MPATGLWGRRLQKWRWCQCIYAISRTRGIWAWSALCSGQRFFDRIPVCVILACDDLIVRRLFLFLTGNPGFCFCHGYCFGRHHATLHFMPEDTVTYRFCICSAVSSFLCVFIIVLFVVVSLPVVVEVTVEVAVKVAVEVTVKVIVKVVGFIV